jgi:predicted RNase H-like nuclease (RuvC/YqgF family)
MGVDVEPGCRGGSDRCYSVALVEDGRLIAKYESIPLYRLIRLAWEYKPDLIAVDNITELASSEHELAKLASMLPVETGIIQVTRLPDGSFVDIRKLAKLAGLEPGQSKPTPLRTAYLAAMLAYLGYGSQVKFVEEKTKIVISKSRRLKHGGMSNPRFQRRVRAAILRAMKDVKKLLDKHRIDYDLMIRKSGGGLDSAIFVVYASRDALKGLVKPYEDNDVRIEIKPVYTGKILFETVENDDATVKPYLIVGVDPGISTAVALIDIHGRFINAVSRRGFDRSEVIEFIRQHGVPVLVATDVRPAPDFVKKLASTLGVPVYEPPASLTVEEKRSIFESYTQKYPRLRRIADSHIRDALAAAIKAYMSYEPKFRQIDSYTSKIGLEINIDAVKADVIRGATIAEAVERAINQLLTGVTPHTYLVRRVRREAGGQQARQEQKEEPAREQDRLRMEIEKLRAENRVLRDRLEELVETIRRLESEYRLFKMEHNQLLEKDREVARLANEVALLRSELEKERQRVERLKKTLQNYSEALMLVAKGLAVPILAVEELDSRSFERIKSTARMYGKLAVKVNTFNPVQWRLRGGELRDAILAILLPESQMKYRDVIEDSGIPALQAEKYVLFEDGEMGVADSRMIIDAYERLEQIRREEMEREAGREVSKETLLKIISEYRSARAKLLLSLEDGDLTLDEEPS